MDSHCQGCGPWRRHQHPHGKADILISVMFSLPKEQRTQAVCCSYALRRVSNCDMWIASFQMEHNVNVLKDMRWARCLCVSDTNRRNLLCALNKDTLIVADINRAMDDAAV